MPIVVMKKSKKDQRTTVTPTPIAQEKYLQEYIHDNPDAIPLDDIREDIQLFVFARELQTSSGAIDALAIDDEGAIYIIETKLYKNRDKRAAVAQVLDYGAALWNNFGDYSEIERAIDEAVGMPFRQKLSDVFEIDDEQAGSILNRFESDLRSGRFTFIVLMDRLDDQLKDLIAFINANSQFRLLGCEMELYRYEDLEILIPKLYGTETRSVSYEIPDRGKEIIWTERTFFEDVSRRRLGQHVENKIRELYDYAKERADRISWGRGTSTGSFNPKYKQISRKSIFTMFSNGVLQVNLAWLTDDESTREFRRKLKDALERRAGLVSRYEDNRPRFEVHEWVDKVAGIKAGLDEVLGTASNQADAGDA